MSRKIPSIAGEFSRTARTPMLTSSWAALAAPTLTLLSFESRHILPRGRLAAPHHASRPKVELTE